MDATFAKGRIVVGVDGSVGSQNALAWAAGEASSRGVGLEVVHAWTQSVELYPAGAYVDTRPHRVAGEATVSESMRQLDPRALADLEVRSRLIEGEAASSLADAAVGADLLVVGCRGLGGFAGLLLGSISRKCLYQSRCPVVVVPMSWSGAGVDRVVVGVDGSDGSRRALEWAVTEAARHGASLQVVNVYDDRPASSVIGYPAPSREDLEKLSQVLLEEVAAGPVGSVGQAAPAVELVSLAGHASRVLIEASRSAALLVVGARGAGGLRGLILGSVSQQCAQHARCPVAVV